MRTVPPCQSDLNDPEWWVGEHGGFSHKLCMHAYAQHLCQNHCPVLAQCKRWVDSEKFDWHGTVVVGGYLMFNTRSTKRPVRRDYLEGEVVVCYLCPEEEEGEPDAGTVAQALGQQEDVALLAVGT